MSKLRNLLKQSGGSTVDTVQSPPTSPPRQSTAAPTAPIKHGSLAALKQKRASEPTPVAQQKPSDPLTEIAHHKVRLTNDVVTWPDQVVEDNGDNRLPPQFRELLHELLNSLSADDVDDVLNRTLQFLHESPALVDVLLPEDINIMVRGLHAAHGTVIAKKMDNKGKRTAKNEQATAMAAVIADLGF